MGNMSHTRPSAASPPRTSAEIRQSFLDFFAARGHTIVPSAPLIPADDPTLLFTNSGMVQFKDVFLGTGERPYRRAADSQKCLRVAGKHNDLDDVGRDDIHHTFFEMLGNWSFGDYYKAEAIAWAWELLTQVWGLPRQDLWVTCFEDEQGVIPRDDEAAAAWRAQPGLDPARILFLGRKENFWEMANTGPCGPDTEIHIDRGPQHCDRQDVPGHVCRVAGDCQRYVELWNLVFIQYNRSSPTELEPLPRKHVDTGMGFERVVSVLQGVSSTYRTDLLWPLIEEVQRRTGHSDAEREADFTPYRVIADHARAAAFLVADGVIPGNLGRNYVCRMIVRRASRFGSRAGIHGPFLAAVADRVVAGYGAAYPELIRQRAEIQRTLTEEEERFQRTVDSAVARAQQLMDAAHQGSQGLISGENAFDLYATYGLPLEILRDMARENGLQVDESGFQKAMDAHRLASSAADAFGAAADGGGFQALWDSLRASGTLGAQGVEHDPYGPLTSESKLVGLLRSGEPVGEASPGERVAAVLPRTPFYVESGGQVSDTGGLVATTGDWEIAVEDVKRPLVGLIVHLGTVVRGNPKVGDVVQATVDAGRRLDIMRNHTATHLLHASLQRVLGTHARQAGSLVAPDRLRFDFQHSGPMTPEELDQVEVWVNRVVLDNQPVRVELKPQKEAIAEGAMALFGEAYGDTVRTIRIGNVERVSYELCGGTHLPSTGVIGPFFILNEGSAAAGIRRIEAVTGRKAVELAADRLRATRRLAQRLGTASEDLESRVEALVRDRERLAEEVERGRKGQAQLDFDRMLADIRDVRGVKLLQAQVDADAETLRDLTDRFREKVPSGVVVLGSKSGPKPLIVAAVTPDLNRRGVRADELVRHMASHIGGGGGGKPTLAQAGGSDPSGMDKALASSVQFLEEHLA
jgi:alanyl-tRNA synthetase